MTIPNDNTNELLAELHRELISDLLLRVRSGEATAAELAAAIRFLKDNNITAVPVPGSGLDELRKSLPFPTEADAELY